MDNTIISIYTDGGSRGNPGESAIGFVAYDQERKMVFEYGEYIGFGTNNEAEYTAVLKSFEQLKNYAFKEIHFFCDSLLVVKQLSGVYKIKNSRMRKLWDQVKVLEKKYKKVTYQYIPREQNTRADFLVNKALDNA